MCSSDLIRSDRGLFEVCGQGVYNGLSLFRVTGAKGIVDDFLDGFVGAPASRGLVASHEIEEWNDRFGSDLECDLITRLIPHFGVLALDHAEEIVDSGGVCRLEAGHHETDGDEEEPYWWRKWESFHGRKTHGE